MFSPDIVCSDAFLDMPTSARDLYFQLGMRADDDGFVNPKMVMRMLGSAEDDLKVLLAKRFVLTFDSGVVVIKHWLIHNLIRADLYKETLYKTEKSALGLNEVGSYTEIRDGVHPIKSIEPPKWLKIRRGELRTANVPQTALRLGQDRLGKKDFAEPKSSSSEEIRIEPDVDKEVKDKKDPANKQALALREWAYQQITNEHGARPTTNMGDYIQITKALKKGLTETDVRLMVEDAISIGKGQTVRSIFTDREIDLYAQTNL